MTYAVLAFYHLEPITNPEQEIERWKHDLSLLDARGRIYINEQGINSQMSVSFENLAKFESWLYQVPAYKNISVKVHKWHEHAFEKLIIKYRKQLVAFDTPIDFSKRGHEMSPLEWEKTLNEKDPNTVVLDVRNQYEYDVGHFEGALAPDCDNFRGYHKFADKFVAEHDPKKTRVLMYCTGGIRCELFSSYLIEKGFDNVHQLHGGVIQYGLDVGSHHWQGKLFVFDDRMAIPISQDNNSCISHCKHCSAPTDDVYNCANTDCNNMFCACSKCVELVQGCCCKACTQSPRLRPLEHQNPHKPFRKWHLYREPTQKS